jgi:hypothetical protein
MPASGAVRGAGSTVRAGVGDPVSWTNLLGIESFDFPDQSPPELDATTLESPNDTEEAIPGMKPVAPWSIDLHYVPDSATDTVLSGLDTSKEAFQLGLKAGTASERIFAGYVKSYIPKGLGPKGIMMATLSVVVQAEITT